MGPVFIPFKFFIGEITNGKKSVLSKCAGVARLKGTKSTLENKKKGKSSKLFYEIREMV